MALTIRISSFSYKTGAGIPTDPSGNGGGFVFDCRCLPNPGRDGRNADKTGFDEGVIQELESSPEVQAFLRSCSELILQAVKKYRERGFEHLMISFGCTGGQHRSVYFANHFARALVGPDIQIELEHQSLKEKGFLKGDIQCEQ